MSGGRRPALLAILAVLTLLPTRSPAASSAEQLARDLESRGIRNERVLDAFRRVRRDSFAPAAARGRAYDDAPLDIGHGQTMSEPYVVALMTEVLGLEGNERVLEIGTGSGYHAAILATLAREVYSIERVPELATSARLALTRAGFRNVHVKQGDGTLGWREYGPYDAIVVTAAAPTVPPALIDELREGGVLIMPLGNPAGRQVLVRGVKRGIKLRMKEIAEVRFVPLLGGSGAAVAPARRAPGRDAERAPGRDAERAPRAVPRDVAPDLDDEEDVPRPRDRDQTERPPPRAIAPGERGGPPPTFNEEELPERDESGPESDRRPRPGARTRAALARGARDTGRRCAARAAAIAASGSPAPGCRSAV